MTKLDEIITNERQTQLISTYPAEFFYSASTLSLFVIDVFITSQPESRYHDLSVCIFGSDLMAESN